MSNKQCNKCQQTKYTCPDPHEIVHKTTGKKINTDGWCAYCVNDYHVELCSRDGNVWLVKEKGSKDGQKCDKCGKDLVSGIGCKNCSTIKEIFETCKLIKAKLESDGNLILTQEIDGKIEELKIKSSDMENQNYGSNFKPIKDYLQRTNKTTLAYENGELVLDKGNKEDNNQERERERERERQFWTISSKTASNPSLFKVINW